MNADALRVALRDLMAPRDPRELSYGARFAYWVVDGPCRNRCLPPCPDCADDDR